MISRFGLLVVVVAVLLGSSIAVDTLRHNRVGALATTPKDEGTRFFDQEVRPRVDEELADNDLIIRRHYVVEREYYNVWVTQTVFILISRAFGIEMATLRDPQLAAAALSDAKAEALAWAMYETRHYLRIKIREREEQRKCMKLLVAFMRYRDRKAYGNPDGPTWDWLLERKVRKYDAKVQQDQPIDKRISLDIIFSAAAPNDFVNAFIEWVASKTGGTMTQEERENLMRNAGISQEDVDELKKMSERVVCPRQKESDSQLPNEALAFDFALSHPEMKEIQGDIEMEQPLLTRIPSSGDVKRKNPE